MNAPQNTQCLLETPYFRVVNEGGYYIIKEAKQINGVVVIPMLPDGRLMLAELQRRAIGGKSLEFPRGAIDAGEAAVEAAGRELLEETGWGVSKIEQLGILHSNTSLIASAVSVCLVHTDGPVTDVTDGEVDNLIFVSLTDLKAMVVAGKITDGHTLSAAMMLMARAT
jgi:ADP-ribose pyrophosphatase